MRIQTVYQKLAPKLRGNKHFIVRSLVGVLIAFMFIFHANDTLPQKWLEYLELKAYDLRLHLSLPKRFNDAVVIADIDEVSLSNIGHWPWSRDILAELIDTLFNHYQIKVIGLDAVFSEATDDSGLGTLQTLAKGPLQKNQHYLAVLEAVQEILDYDGRLAKSFTGRDVISGYTFHYAQDIQTGKLPAPVFTAATTRQYSLPEVVNAQGYVANLAQLQEQAVSSGAFGTFFDPDGLVRRVPLLFLYGGELYQSLALATFRQAMGNPPLTLLAEDYNRTPHTLLIGTAYRIPLDDKLNALVPFLGGSGSFPYYSISSILAKTLPPEKLRGKILLLGSTAQGLLDLRGTPVSPTYPGVETHANLILAMMEQRFLRIPLNSRDIEVVILIAITLLMLLVFSHFSVWNLALSSFALLFFVSGANVLVWQQYSLVIPLTGSILLILALQVFLMAYGYFVESRNKRHLAKLFGQYVPPELVEEMSARPEQDLSMEGESRMMSVMFLDVRNFTAISEVLTPQQLTKVMDEIFTPFTEVIYKNRGTVDKYIGDCIMAFWGAPLEDPKHSSNAVNAALGLEIELQKLQAVFAAKGYPFINIGVGINSGEMVVGNMGSQYRLNYSVLGDAVNLSSRLEGLSKAYGVRIVVSEMTYREAPEFLYRELDRVRVKGKQAPVRIFEPLGRREALPAEVSAEVETINQALAAYQQQDWATAKALFSALRDRALHLSASDLQRVQVPAQSAKDSLMYDLYLARIAQFQANPPGADWDGVYTFKTK